jgi:hypothetical protein
MQPTRRARVVILALAASTLLATASHIRAQVVSSLTPLALRPGQTQDLVVRGSGLTDARQLWTSFSQKTTLTPGAPKNGRNPAEVSFRVTVPAQAPLGIYGLRVTTTSGVSPLRLVMLDELPTVHASGANVSRASAQPLSLPTAVEGALSPTQLHYYKLHVEAGQRVSFEVYSRRIGSLLDPTLRLFDAAGREVTYSDDVPGLSEDAAISRTFRAAGDYVLELGDNLYQGGGDYFYHLRIGDFPAAVVPYPLAVQRSQEFTCHFADAAGGSIELVHAKAPSDVSQATLFLPARRSDGTAQGFAAVLLSNHRQATEAEPNNSPKTASPVKLGDDLNGRLETPDDADHFVFRGHAQDFVRFTSISRRLGSPADLVLRLLKSNGTPLATAESQASLEATLSATLPADGDYVLEVRDLNRRGGPGFVYHVESVAEPATPAKGHSGPGRPVHSFALAAAVDSIVIPAGGTAAIPISALRSRYGGPIALRAIDLPAGVKSCPTWMGRGEDAVELTLQSTADLPAGLIHSIRIVGSPEHSESSVTAQTTDAVRSQLGNMPYPPSSLCTKVALVAGPHPGFVLRTEPAAVEVPAGGSVNFKVIAERQKTFDEEIALAVAPAKKGLPPGVTAGIKPIAKGALSTEITITADGKAAPNVATLVLIGTLKKGTQALSEPAPGLGLTIKPSAAQRKTEGKKT